MTKEFPFKKIDAFATAESGGNPAAAICLDAEQAISVREMQRIAQEDAVSCTFSKKR
jgi:predicted PhzF superfamily epimerase YddE/YHI9